MSDTGNCGSDGIEVDSSHLGLILMMLTRKFQRRHDELSGQCQELGLKPSYGGVLNNLSVRSYRLSELAELNQTRPQSMVKIVNELESLAYVERVPDSSDSRAKLVRLTNKGKEMLGLARDTTNDIYQQYVDVVGEDELRAMLLTMAKLVHGLDD